MSQPFLAIDVGNTHSVLGLITVGSPDVGAMNECPKARTPGQQTQIKNQIKKVWRLSTHPQVTADEFVLRLTSLLFQLNLKIEDLRAIVLSSVVPPMVTILKECFGPKLQVIDHRWPFSFRIATLLPEQVGTDRLVNAEAAVREYGAPVIIVDSGTATTICAVSADRDYLGGAILPGMEVSLEALVRRTSKLSLIELSRPEQVIGRTTEEAITSGIFLGYADMIDGLVQRFKRELVRKQSLRNPPVKNYRASSDEVENIPVVATGGVATLLRDAAVSIQAYDSDLTLKGIAYLYDKISR